METAELDVALEELELRLERLRALYEQYFMGIEKIEPAIARKDVDRRIYVLRREKIRNTAKRFKLQTIIQRYNTFQQYWQRICREIENGTYKRHLLRAQKNGELLTIAARKRLGRQARTSQPPDANATPSQPPRASAPPSAPPLPESLPAAITEPVAASAVPRPVGSPPLLRRPPLPGRAAESPATTSAPKAGAAASSPRAAAPQSTAAAAKPAPAKFESLDLDMDFMGDWDPGARKGPAPKPPAPAAKPIPPKMPAARVPAAARPASIPPAPVAVPPRPASSRPPTAPTRPLAPPARPLAAAPPPARPMPPPPAAARPMPPPPAAARPAPSAAARPAPPVVAKAPPPAAPKPSPPAVANPAASPATADDQRLRDLHTRLQQAKLQTKEANVSFEGLAKSIRATEAKLREQHKNRKIEFDVVIKDGKAIVKPIVK